MSEAMPETEGIFFYWHDGEATARMWSWGRHLPAQGDRILLDGKYYTVATRKWISESQIEVHLWRETDA